MAVRVDFLLTPLAAESDKANSSAPTGVAFEVRDVMTENILDKVIFLLAPLAAESDKENSSAAAGVVFAVRFVITENTFESVIFFWMSLAAESLIATTSFAAADVLAVMPEMTRNRLPKRNTQMLKFTFIQRFTPWFMGASACLSIIIFIGGMATPAKAVDPVYSRLEFTSSVSNSTDTAVTFNDASPFGYDGLDLYDSGHPTYLVLPAGAYQISVNIAYEQNNSGNRVTMLQRGLSDVVLDTRLPVSGRDTWSSLQTIFASGGNLYVYARQNSGGALDVWGYINILKVE